MKSINILLVILSLIVIINSSTITIESAKYAEVCKGLEETIFDLAYKVDSKFTEDIEFEMIMTTDATEGKEPIEIKTKCVKSSDDVFTCEFTPSEEGKYHPKLSEDYHSGDHTIKAFELSNYPIGFTTKKYIRPAKQIYNITKYLTESLYQSIQMEYSGVLTQDNLPYVILNGHNLSCSVYFKNSSFLSCDFYKPYYDKRNTSYYGQIINVCGTKDADIDLIILDKEKEFFAIVTDFAENTTELNCGKIIKDKEFYFSYYFFNGAIHQGEVFSIDKIQFVNSANTSVAVNTFCEIGNLKLVCKPIEDATVEGSYKAILTERYNVSREAGDFSFSPFNTTHEIIHNSKYAPLATKEVKVSHDYKTSPEGEISFDFQEVVSSPAKVKINQAELSCTVTDKTQKCKFTKAQLPVDKSQEKEYTGNIINACGKPELEVKINVKDTSSGSKFMAIKIISLIVGLFLLL